MRRVIFWLTLPAVALLAMGNGGKAPKTKYPKPTPDPCVERTYPTRECSQGSGEGSPGSPGDKGKGHGGKGGGKGKH